MQIKSMLEEDYRNGLECRQKELLKFEAKRQLAPSADDLNGDIFGSSAVSRLCLGQDIPAANASLRRTAAWFKNPHPTGRDHRGECDFAAIKLCLAYHVFKGKNLLEAETLHAIKDFFLAEDFASMYPSENHALMFYSSRYLMGQEYQNDNFVAYHQTGAQLHAEDARWLKNFIRYRARRGWGEFDSTCYLIPDWECLSCLHDFANDAEIRHLAAMMMNILLADMVVDSLDGMYCGAHGRIYPPGAHNHTQEATYLLQYLYFETGDPTLAPPKQTHLTGALICRFQPEKILCDIAQNRKSNYENRERKHLHNCADILPLKSIDGSVRKYTYYTPEYVMGCVQYQDPYPSWADGWYAHHQQHQWDLSFATSPSACIFSHHPGDFGEHNYWTGDLRCGCGSFFQNKTALLALYDIPSTQPFKLIHAYLPKDSFDEIIEAEGWVFVRAGQAFAGIKLLPDYQWTTEGEWKDKEIISHGLRHAVICETGTLKDWNDFASFRNVVQKNQIFCDLENMTLEYNSAAGRLFLNTSGKRMLDGTDCNLEYATYDSPYMQSAWDSGKITLQYGTTQQVFDFSK